MKTFDDLSFTQRSTSKHASMKFDNGYGVSVIIGEGTYGGNNGLYELAVLKGESICYTTPITSDVLGWLTPEMVTEAMEKVQKLPLTTD